MKFSISSLVSTSTHMSPPATRWVPLVEQELLIIPEFFSGFPYGSCCSMLCLLYSVLRTLAWHCFSFGHCIFWFYLPLWCLQPIVIGREDQKKKIKAGGAGGHQGPTPWGPGATPWWETRGQKPQELLDFSIFKHSRRDLQGVIF